MGSGLGSLTGLGTFRGFGTSTLSCFITKSSNEDLAKRFKNQTVK